MRYTETKLSGVILVDPERHEDERGFFARLWCRDELAQHGLNPQLAQCSVSNNRRKGTLRGMHYQAEPHAEAKFVQCIRGAIYDVALDLRRDSPSFGKWFAAELTAENRRMLYLPEGCAHGFQTLTDDCDVLYFISTPFHADLSRGVRWDDPAFQIEWPLPVSMISQRDQSYALIADVN
jgi:dTDP-4-dehydrorhamnose 3,5-epimerase